jgi:hypothetical protein
MPERILDFDGTFFRGAKSDADPGQVPIGYYWMGMNVVNVGGTVSCRPGYRCIVQFPDGNLQGAAVFRPLLGLEQMVVVIDGRVYVADFPFADWRMLDNVLMDPVAKQVYWVMAEQSARREDETLTSAIIVQDPRRVLFIQDGATAPAWYDGSNSGHLRDAPFELPVGKMMAWVGDRLWVARGSYLFASDIANPFSFREQIYLGGVGAFTFSGEITALAKTPGVDAPQLLVFAEQNTSLVRANIRERNAWTTTSDMQREIFSIGTTSQRSVVSHFGQLSWFSQQGQIFLDQAMLSMTSARLPIRDNEMHFSKKRLYSDLSMVAGASFGQFMLMSVPFEDQYNLHTWVVNDASFSTMQDDSGPSWAGFWTGTRPVEWVYGSIGGNERAYHVSVDTDGKNRLWETFTPDRLDNGCPITWYIETRGYFGMSSQTRDKPPGSDVTFCYADIALVGIDEDLDLAIFYAGGLRGAYKKILSKKITVTRGSLTYPEEVTATSELIGYKSQVRRFRTQEARSLTDDTETGSCPVESPSTEETDECFQLAIVGQGPATIRWVRAWAQPVGEDVSADGEACEDEAEYNIVRFDGVGARALDLTEAQTSALIRDIQRFTSNQTTTVDQEGQSAVGVGYGESVISQAAADRVATRAAVRAAESELSRTLPKVISAGETL